MMSSITAILNGYKRKENLTEQLDAVQNQTIKPREVLLWYNHPNDDNLINYDVVQKIPTALNNVNYGVWARFAFALNATSEYICIFDDDTIPGKKWFENCINTMKTHEGLLGTVGLLYTLPPPAGSPSDSYFHQYVRFGWTHNNINPVQVDLVGHAWFFKREWLSVFWRELSNLGYNTCGEDMHFSYMLQKYLNINTYVPPHPPKDKEMWGSIKGSEYGGKNSLWTDGPQNQRQLMNQFFRIQRNDGWRLVNDKK